MVHSWVGSAGRTLWKSKAPAKQSRKLSQFQNLWWLAILFGHDFVYVGWIAITYVHFDRARQTFWTQVFNCLATQRKSTQVGFSIVVLSTKARARVYWSGIFSVCVEFASTCESIWPPITSLSTQVHISKLALTCAYVRPGLKFDYKVKILESSCWLLYKRI